MTPSVSDIARHIDRDRVVDRLTRLVRMASENPPGEEAEVAAETRAQCEELGLEVTEHAAEPNRPSIVATMANGEGPTLCYCSHIDVVPAGDHALWVEEPFGAVIKDGRLHGRGSSDAKGPVAAALEAVAALRSAGVDLNGTLQLALVADEEAMGFKGAGYLVDEGIVRPDMAIVGEPTSLRVVRAQRGACWMRIMTKGVATHGSAPERGVSAIKHMAEIVLRLEETMPDITHPIVGGPSISVGTIRGGEKVNIVPAGCLIEVDRRTIPGETRESVLANVQAAIELSKQRFPDLDATAEIAFFAEPFDAGDGDPLVATVRDAVGDALGREAELIGFRGASDARFIAATGASVVLCGPGDITLAHTAREYIEVDELVNGALAYAVSFARLLGAA